MSMTRVGTGYDAHRFGGAGPVVIGGVPIDHATGVLGTSDADVAAHAVCDALLGAAALGDLGTFFPSGDPAWEDADSMGFVRACAQKVRAAGFEIANVDVSIVVESVRIAPHRSVMRSNLAEAILIETDQVSVKATTTDRLGFIGAGDGLAAHATAAIYS